MEAQPYDQLSTAELMALCVWREARGESMYGKRCVAHVINNRALRPGWWGHDVQSVVLKPWQFSSFNPNDPNNKEWPADDDISWTDSLSAANDVLSGGATDPTDGATYYYDVSIGWPAAWGLEKNFKNTLNVGRLRFWKPIENTAA